MRLAAPSASEAVLTAACQRHQLPSVRVLHARVQAPCVSMRNSAKDQQATSQTEDLDIVERTVRKLFGQQALDDRNPFGIKRVDWSKVKDLDVIMDREAEPVATDDPWMAILRPMLAGTSLEEEPLRCAYSATEDGWNPESFHNAVHGYGSCIVLARSKGGAVFGGYNPLGFDGYGMDKSSMGAFLFTWPTGDYKNSKPYKLPKIGSDQMAVIDRMDQGPQFGPGDLKIVLPMGKRAGDQARATSKLINYKRPPSGAKSLFAPDEGRKAELVELKAYVRKGGKLKYELDGIRWKSYYAKDGSGEGPPPGIVSM